MLANNGSSKHSDLNCRIKTLCGPAWSYPKANGSFEVWLPLAMLPLCYETVMKKIYIVIPVYNEGERLEDNLQVIRDTISGMNNVYFRFLIVNDGSTDSTATCLIRCCRQHEDMVIISLTRNFGKEAALLAGLEHSKGDAAIVMDSDLQHPPELIPQMVRLWQEGVDVVEACKSSRGRESLVQKTLAGCFYRFFSALAGRDLSNHSDFKLLDQKVVQTYLKLPERQRFFRGLVAWMGYSSAQIYFDVPERKHGRSGWSRWQLLRYSMEALTGFSSIPLYLILLTGLLCFIISITLGSWTLYMKLSDQAVSGFTTVILLLLLIGSFIMFGLGLIGIYLGQVFNEIKNRPVFIIKEHQGESNQNQS